MLTLSEKQWQKTPLVGSSPFRIYSTYGLLGPFLISPVYGWINQANAICLHIRGRIFPCRKGYSCHWRPPCNPRIVWFAAAKFFGGKGLFFLPELPTRFPLYWLCYVWIEQCVEDSRHWIGLREYQSILSWFDKISKISWRVSFLVFCLQGALSPMLSFFVNLRWQLAWRHKWPWAIISSLIIISLPFILQQILTHFIFVL